MKKISSKIILNAIISTLLASLLIGIFSNYAMKKLTDSQLEKMQQIYNNSFDTNIKQ